MFSHDVFLTNNVISRVNFSSYFFFLSPTGCLELLAVSIIPRDPFSPDCQLALAHTSQKVERHVGRKSSACLIFVLQQCYFFTQMQSCNKKKFQVTFLEINTTDYKYKAGGVLFFRLLSLKKLHINTRNYTYNVTAYKPRLLTGLKFHGALFFWMIRLVKFP